MNSLTTIVQVPQNEQTPQVNRRLGRLPRKSSRKALLFSDFFKVMVVPPATNFWTKRRALPLRSFGNTDYGDCTRAKQAMAQMRFERLEQRSTINVTDAEVIRVYLEMTQRLYGGGDTGAYEEDALNEWRRPETTFKDVKSRPYTIDAFVALNTAKQDELRSGIALSGAHGIAVCFNLPAAWAPLGAGETWALPPGQSLTGNWMPGSWGGHSMWALDYTQRGMMVDGTWKDGPRLVTWDAVAAYCDEAHMVIDSVDAWRKKVAKSTVGHLDLDRVVDAVNDVSSYPILQGAA